MRSAESRYSNFVTELLRIKNKCFMFAGEGVFQGLPLALASMRIVMERMDWGLALRPEQKARPSDATNRRTEALIRFGSLGRAELADDDDVILVISPQNSECQKL